MAAKPSAPVQFILELKDYKSELESHRDDLDAIEEPTMEQAEALAKAEAEIEDVESLIDTLEAF